MSGYDQRTDAQLVHNLNQKLDVVWRLGDRDECSIKHIGHATAAMAAGRDWFDGVDYSTPWSGLTEVHVNLARRLERQWAKVTKVRDEIGAERFDQVMRQTKFDWYHAQNLEFHWKEQA